MLTCLAGRAGMSVWDWVDMHSGEPSAEPKPVIASAGPLSLFLLSTNTNPASFSQSFSLYKGAETWRITLSLLQTPSLHPLEEHLE